MAKDKDAEVNRQNGQQWNDFDLSIGKDRFRFAKRAEVKAPQYEEHIGSFRGAMARFIKNGTSVAGAAIIFLILLFSVIVPAISPYGIDYSESVYNNKPPRSRYFSQFGVLDGRVTRIMNQNAFTAAMAIGMGAHDGDGTGDVEYSDGINSPYAAVKEVGDASVDGNSIYREVTVDAYMEVGFRFVIVDDLQLEAIKLWEKQNGKQVIYPMIDTKNHHPWAEDANIWYKTDGTLRAVRVVQSEGAEVLEQVDITKGEKLEPNYLLDENSNPVYEKPSDNTMWKIRVLYYNYYQFEHNAEPYHLLGTDNGGYDIGVRLASSVRFSLGLAVCVSALNLIIGAVYGAVEGYYGGTLDMALERISEIIGGLPFIVVVTLFQLHFAAAAGSVLSLLFAFTVSGWISTASRVRTQFYRFKNAEYVLAAKTLGASDGRIIFRHIFPNAAGTVITSSVLMIPKVIFSESMLTYLGIVSGDSVAGLGAMLAEARELFTVYPYQMFFPALVLSLMMISFNLLGNGLREAFDPLQTA